MINKYYNRDATKNLIKLYDYFSKRPKSSYPLSIINPVEAAVRSEKASTVFEENGGFGEQIRNGTASEVCVRMEIGVGWSGSMRTT